MVEVQSERKLKKLRTDNGLEFCNQVFDKHCKEHGIVRHRTCTYTPQQNGVAERLNRTIMNKVRSMLSESGLNKRFWAEAASTAVFLINRSPSSALNFKVPEEMWTSVMPSLKNLRRFGCLSYIHSSEGKLDPRAKRAIFIGYPEGTKGFKVWIIDEDKCTIGRNIVFKEDTMYKDLKSGIISQNKSPTTNEIVYDTGSLDEQRTEDTVQGGAGNELSNEQAEENQTEGHTEEEAAEYNIARDRTRRQINPPQWFQDYDCDPDDADENLCIFECYITEDAGFMEPTSYEEAMKNSDSDLWTEATDEEMSSLNKNKTWIYIDRPKNKKVIGCKWVFKRKAGISGVEKPRYKARLVAKGYSQREGIDYNEIFAPVVKHVTIRYLLSVVAHFNMELHQLDVKTAFLHGNLEEFIVMEQPEGYIDKENPDKVCLLKKSLYGLKQSPRQWNKRFHDFMTSKGYIRSEYDYCVYLKKLHDSSYLYLLLYVDDILIASTNNAEISKLKSLLSSEFEMKDLGEAKKILGMEITRNRAAGTLNISQQSYLRKVLDNFKMDQSKEVSTPLGAHFRLRSATDKEAKDQQDVMKAIPYQSAVGSIMYSMVCTRPDLAYPVGLISRFMSKPLKEHWQAVKWLLRYIKGSVSTGLSYRKDGLFEIEGYCDSDYAADLDNRKSISGIVFTAGGNAISWKSRLQKVVALSTTEAEYVALSEAGREALWLKGIAEEFGFPQSSVRIHCDSQSAIALAKNAVHHERTKHVAVKYHFIRDYISEGALEVQKIATAYNPADIFTKIIPVQKLQEALQMLRVTRQ